MSRKIFGQCLIALILAGPLFAVLVAARPAAAQDPTPSPAERALGDTSWYDADQRQVVPVKVKPIVDDTLHRDSRWLPKAQRVAKPPPVTGGGGTAGGGGGGTGAAGIFGTGLTIGNLFGWMLLVAITIGGIAILLYALSKAEIDLGQDITRSRSTAKDAAPDEQMVERMKHLPAELRRTDVNLRSEAERLMNAGQYEQAIILLFAHQLLLLDRVGMLRLNRGKTNGKYVRETRSVDPESGQRLRATVAAFERSYFGRHDIERDAFREIWQSNLKLEESVQRRQELAA